MKERESLLGVKNTYLRYIPTSSMGIINSTQCQDILLDPSGKLAITATLNQVGVFNIKLNSQIRWLGPRYPTFSDPYDEIPRIGEVTSLSLSPDGLHVSAGYSSGVILIYNYYDQVKQSSSPSDNGKYKYSVDTCI